MSDNWQEKYFKSARERAAINDTCERYRYINGTRCNNKSKFIIIFSEMNGAWSILSCVECARYIQAVDKDPKHPDNDPDSAVAVVEPIESKLAVLK